MDELERLKVEITERINAAEERLDAKYDSAATTISGYQLEGVNLLKAAEDLTAKLLNISGGSIPYIEFTKRIEDVWSAFARRRLYTGLDYVGRVGRNK